MRQYAVDRTGKLIMSSILKGLLFILLGFVMLAWFAYGIIFPPVWPSETYSLDWVMVVVRLVGGVSLIIGGIIQMIFGDRKVS